MRTQFNGLMIGRVMIGAGIALLAASVTYAQPVFAQTASASDAPPPAEALPPPAMDDPGTVATAPASTKHDKRSKSAATSSTTLPPLPPESAPTHSAQANSVSAPATGELTSTDPMPPKPSLVSSAPAAGTPTTDTRIAGENTTVSIRTMPNGDRIEEYRSGGQLTRVKVTPNKAPPYEIIDTNGNGHLDDHDKNSEKTVGWTLFKWH